VLSHIRCLDPRVRLTEIETVNVRVLIEKYSLTTSCLSHAMSSKIKIEFGPAALGRTMSLFKERKIVDFVDRCKQIFEISILGYCSDFE